MTADDPIRAAREELADPSISRATDLAGGEQPGDRIHHYKLLQVVGEGGMGTVWMAEQTEPVRRRVALKIIKLGMDTREVIVRFEAERQALAMMEHPHIARVFDGGATASGRPFFVMELVRGVPITTYCEQARLDLRARLELFAKVCGAIHHAHQKGVIHRDIKPSNVLVTLHDGVPVPKVIDFGIAKATDAELTQKTLFTRYAQMIGTPEYMAPEQAEMSGLDIDTRADVYSLGVLLYELVTGSTPFRAADALAKGYAELLKTIREVDPARPSNRVSTQRTAAIPVDGLRHADLHALSRALRGDLDCIVMKALEKDRHRRYDSASAFAEDIARHIDDRPVHAAPPSRRYLLQKAIRRHKAAVTAGVTVFLLLVAGIAGTAYGLLEAIASLEVATEARRKAERAQLEAQTVADFTDGILRGVDPREAAGRDTRLLRDLMDDAARDLEARDLRHAPEAELRLRVTIGSVYASLGATESARDLLGTALRQARELHPEPNATTAAILMALGLVHLELEERSEGRERYRAAQAILHQLDGDEARLLLAQIDNDLALLARRDGDLDTAEQLIRRAVETKRALRHVDGAMLEASLGILGSVLDARGDLGAAAAAFDEALELARRSADGPSVEQVVALGNAAYLAMRRDRPGDAEPLCRASLEAARACYDGDHHFVASALTGLADCMHALGRPKESLELLEEAYAMTARIFPPTHPRVLASASRLANAQRFVEGAADPLELSARALARIDALPPSELDLKVSILQAHGLLLIDAGRRDEAATLLNRALALARASAAYPATDLAALLLDVAQSCDPNADPDARVALLDEAVELARANAPDDGSLLLANALDNLGEATRGERGIELLREALAMKRRRAPADHPDTSITAKKLAIRLTEAGDPAAALPLAEEALASLRLRRGERHPSTLGAMCAVAMASEAMGDSARAASLLEAVLSSARELPPAQGAHLIAPACARLLPSALARGDLETATALADEALAAWALAEAPPGISTAVAHINAGYVAMQREQVEPARRHFLRAAELYDAAPDRTDLRAVLNLMQLGYLERAAGDPKAAREAFERMLRTADRMPDAPSDLRFRAASEILSLELAGGDPRAALRAAKRAAALADLALPDQPRPRHGLRVQALLTCFAALEQTAEPTARRELLDEAETVAREIRSIATASFVDDRSFRWLIPDAASKLGRVLFLKARELAESNPDAARELLDEARARALEGATEIWSDRWPDDNRPQTAREVAAWAAELLDHLERIEPGSGHAEQAAGWRERAGMAARR